MIQIGKRRNETRLAINDSILGKMRPELQIGIMVIHRAMMDWHLLIDRRAWEQETLARPNFAEIRQFFNSRWCASICRGCEVMTPEHMLDILERELRTAMNKPLQSPAERVCSGEEEGRSGYEAFTQQGGSGMQRVSSDEERDLAEAMKNGGPPRASAPTTAKEKPLAGEADR